MRLLGLSVLGEHAWFVSWFTVVDFTYILGSGSEDGGGVGGRRSCVFGVCVGLRGGGGGRVYGDPLHFFKNLTLSQLAVSYSVQTVFVFAFA